MKAQELKHKVRLTEWNEKVGESKQRRDSKRMVPGTRNRHKKRIITGRKRYWQRQRRRKIWQ